MKPDYLKICILCIGFTQWILQLQAQDKIPLTGLGFFQDPPSSWSIVGDVNSGFEDKAVLSLSTGTGILANLTDMSHPGHDILTKQLYGGMDIELDYLMAPGSNSGIYLQGRYEVQLRDSWGTVLPTSADNGGIYERWNENKPDGQKGYDGHAPRQNVSRAPGTWQHMKISFQAPRFNGAGQKTGNARMLRVELNGVPVQENIELSGPTRGALGNDEVPRGPLRLQGDHGSVAFRNIKITSFDNLPPALVNLKYAVYKGKYEEEIKFLSVPPESSGTTEILSTNITRFPTEFLIQYKGVLQIKSPGSYHFSMNLSGGRGSLKINNQGVIFLGQGSGRGSGNITLPVGEFPFDLIYSKLVVWDQPMIGVEVAGPGIRSFKLSDANVGADHEDPILVSADVNTLLRSFSDIDTFKVTHAVNVGSPMKVHYTYDLDKGMIVQVWRGDFLDVSSMWHGRGDGTAHPQGVVLQFGRPLLAINDLGSSGMQWSSDTSGSGFRPKGYIMDETDRPAFQYFIYRNRVKDKTTVLPNSKGIQREISLEKSTDHLYLRLATAKNIETLSNGVYLLDDKTYYLRMDDTGQEKPVIRAVDGQMEIIVQIHQSVRYSILF